MGHGKDEPLAVHIVKSYCLPVLLYGCEIGKMSPSNRHKIDVAWKKFNACWREIAKTLLFYCYIMSADCIVSR